MVQRAGADALLAVLLWSSHASAGTVTLGEGPRRFMLDPSTLAVSVDQAPVNAPQPARDVADLRSDGRATSRWPWARGAASRRPTRFDRFNQARPFRVRLHVGQGWLSAALRYRRWLQEHGDWESLEEPAKLKTIYRETVFHPRDRVPLYQAVFHDAIINSHHWQTDSLKFSEVVADRALLNLLYNTPPLFNLSRATLGERLPALRRLDAVFRPLHEALWNQALVGFRWLDAAGLVQETRFGDGSRITANFGLAAVAVDGEPLSGRSARARLADGREIAFVFTGCGALRSARGVTSASRRSQSAARRRGDATLRAPDTGAGGDLSSARDSATGPTLAASYSHGGASRMTWPRDPAAVLVHDPVTPDRGRRLRPEVRHGDPRLIVGAPLDGAHRDDNGRPERGRFDGSPGPRIALGKSAHDARPPEPGHELPARALRSFPRIDSHADDGATGAGAGVEVLVHLLAGRGREHCALLRAIRGADGAGQQRACDRARNTEATPDRHRTLVIRFRRSRASR